MKDYLKIKMASLLTLCALVLPAISTAIVGINKKSNDYQVGLAQATPQILYSEDFSGSYVDFVDHVSVSDGVATLTDDNVPFNFSNFPKSDDNNYVIEFDLNLAKEGADTFFFHLNNYYQGASIYFAFQTDGHICINAWKDGIWHYVYGFQENLGGSRSGDAVISWYNKGTGLNHIKITLYEGYIGLDVNGEKYIYQHLSNFGAYTNNPTAAGSVVLTEGNLESLVFHPVRANCVELDNLVIKEVADPVSSFTHSSPAEYTFNTGYEIMDIAYEDFRADAVFAINNANTKETNVQLNLRGLNGTTDVRDGGNKSVNVQLNFDFGDGRAYPCIFWCRSLFDQSDWGAYVAPLYSVVDKTTIKVSFLSYGDRVLMLLDDEVIIDTTYTSLGMPRGKMFGLGIVESADVTFQSLTFKQLSGTSAAAFDDLVDDIGTVSYPTSKTKIDAARGAYNALNGEQKLLVTKYSVLLNDEAQYYALYFLNETGAVCSVGGEDADHKTALLAIWDDLSDAWDELVIEARDILKTGTASDDIEEFVDRYDHITDRYGLDEFNNFSSARSSLLDVHENNINNVIIILSIVSSIALIVAGSLLLSKKKKKQ